MKLSLWLVTLGLSGAFAPVAWAQDAAPLVAPAELSASQILTKSRQTYAAFSVYKGTCSVVTDALIAVEDAEPMQNVSSASAKIEFARGERLAVEGVDMGGSAFKALWTPDETWLEVMAHRGAGIGPGPEDKTERKIIKGTPDFAAQDALLASMSGFTGGTGSKIPNALMPDKFDLGNPFTKLGEAKLLNSKQLGAKICYVVQVTTPELNRVDTYWIERNSFLLRRMTEEIGEQRYDDIPEFEGKPMPILRVGYSLNQFVFATTEAK